MERFKKICRGLLVLHPVWIILLTAASSLGLGWVFLTGHESHWLSYPIYVLSFYALTVLCVWLVPLGIRRAKTPRPVKTPEQVDGDFRGSLKTGLAMNLVYAVFHLVMGTVSESPWTGSQGAYQLVMALIHGVLLIYENRRHRAEGDALKLRVCWDGFRVSGIWMLILHLTMTGLIFQTVWRGETKNSHEIMVIGVAAYTFYKLTMALIRVIRCRKNPNPLWGAARNIDLSESIMNLFTLQASLLSVYATEQQGNFRFLMNTLFGGAVCIMTVGGAVGMIVHGSKKKQEVLEMRKDGA